jgi:hypothetical protein
LFWDNSYKKGVKRIILEPNREYAEVYSYYRVCKGGNQNPYIEEEQTTQWSKEKNTKGQTTIYQTYI